MSKRRDFIKKSSYAAAASLILPAAANAFGLNESSEKEIAEVSANKMEVGIQVYSVRNQLKEDFAGSMKKLADIGYQIIEGYGLGLDGKFLGQYTAAEYKKVVTDLGMRLVATHCGYFSSDDAPKMIEASKAAGLEYLVIPGIPRDIRKTVDDYKAIAENFNKIGEQFNAAGINFGYHNHAFEFDAIDNYIPMDILISNTDADKVTFEADLFWVNKAGHNPVDLIKKYPGRISLFHVKDANAEKEEATVGQGVIDFKSIFKIGKKKGLQYYFIEDERTDDPFGNNKANFDYISVQKFT
jgi:sugar phosphate isomerase/epimerase